MNERTKAAVLLSILSPLIAEVLSGSTTPAELLNPFSFPFLWAFYGGGVLIMRELWIRFHGGYARLMLLGTAYGVIEEGLAVKSFFNPAWKDLGVLAHYGRFAGVNMVWAVWLSIYHSIFSITLPIIIVHGIFPHLKNEKLLGKRGMIFAGVIFLVALLLTCFFLVPYNPPVLAYMLTLLLALSLILSAKMMRVGEIMLNVPGKKHPFTAGALVTLSLFFIFFFIPNTFIPPPVPCVLGVFVFIIFYALLRNLGRFGQLYLALGLISPYTFFLCVVEELEGARGMSVVGALAFILLLWEIRRLEKEDAKIINTKAP